jgi:shikimate kinase
LNLYKNLGIQQEDKHKLSDDSLIFIVGFMGAGKTTVGQALARQLEYDFYDLDELISSSRGQAVQQIFSQQGETEFRRLESEAILSFSKLEHAVIALGGGAYVSEKNRFALREIGKTVWLDCPLELCLERIRGDQSRPLLGDEAKMRSLLEQRRPAYHQADFVVQAGDRSPEELAREIIELMSK